MIWSVGADVLDQRGAEGQVVGVAAGAGAHLALQGRVGQVFVVAHLVGRHAELVVNDDPGAGREREPAVGVQVVGDRRLEGVGLHRCEHPGRVGGGEAGGVDGDEHVGGAVGALVADALEKLVFLALDAVDLDAGLRGEVAVERLVGLVMAGRVEVEFGVGGGGLEGGGAEEQGGERFQQGHRRGPGNKDETILTIMVLKCK